MTGQRSYVLIIAGEYDNLKHVLAFFPEMDVAFFLIPHFLKEDGMRRETIRTGNAPQAIGTYSQAIRMGNTVYLSGQIGLDPQSMLMADGIEAQIHRVFGNLGAVAAAAGGSLNDVVKLNIFLTDLGFFGHVNEVMASYFKPPYPARATVGVSGLPRSALVEMDAVMVLDGGLS
jgi:reactive intermediate/imine deaminase